MNISKVKTLTIVLVLLLIAGFVSVGCSEKKHKDAWVNTNSMPGQTFHPHGKGNVSQNTSTIVYLGSDRESKNINFGPQDVNFDFKNLR